ncbi:MAG: energy transducer TonB [Nitrospinota bacterium]
MAGLGRGEIRDFEREVSKYALVGGAGTGRQSIRGPAAARRIVFRPPPPIVKNLESSGDIELRFWVLSDGTVGRVVPIRKGSAYLEAIAGNNLRQWRFTALRHDEPPREEWGQIIYRFRIR